VDNDLTALSGGSLTPLLGSPASYGASSFPGQGPRVPLSSYWQTTDQSQHVDFDSNGDVQELSFHPEFAF
jgi:hypothetical protein